MTASNFPETYQVEEIQEILQLAIAHREADGELSRQQLEEIAADLGIPQDSLMDAEQAWLAQKDRLQKQTSFNLYRRQIFKHKAIRFAIVNGFLLAINILGTGYPSWSLYVLLVWGLFFTLKGWRLLQTSGNLYDIEFQKWERKVQLRQSVETLWQKTQNFLNGTS